MTDLDLTYLRRKAKEPPMPQSVETHPLGFNHWRSWLFWPHISLFQRVREAWWILTGKWSLHRAWQIGHDQGAQAEYRRTVIRGGR